jgi:hypothetical protein
MADEDGHYSFAVAHDALAGQALQSALKAGIRIALWLAPLLLRLCGGN